MPRTKRKLALTSQELKVIEDFATEAEKIEASYKSAARFAGFVAFSNHAKDKHVVIAQEILAMIREECDKELDAKRTGVAGTKACCISYREAAKLLKEYRK